MKDFDKVVPVVLIVVVDVVVVDVVVVDIVVVDVEVVEVLVVVDIIVDEDVVEVVPAEVIVSEVVVSICPVTNFKDEKTRRNERPSFNKAIFRFPKKSELKSDKKIYIILQLFFLSGSIFFDNWPNENCL